MKKLIVFVALIAAVATAAEAQRIVRNTPTWTFSKEIVKTQHSHVLYTPALITTAQAPVVSKGIARWEASRREMPKQQVVMRRGKPSIAISKGIAKHQYARKDK